MIGGVTRRGLPHLPGAPHLHVNMPWGLVLVVFLSISLTVQNGNLQSWSLPFFTCFSWLSIRWARRVGRIQVTESFQKSTFPNRRLNANRATTVCPCRFSVMIFVDSLWCGRRSPHLLSVMTCSSSLFGWFSNVNVTAVTSARRKLQTGLTNGSEGNWASEVTFSLSRTFAFLFDAALHLLNLPYHSSLWVSSRLHTPISIHHTHSYLCGGGKTRVPFWGDPCTSIET